MIKHKVPHASQHLHIKIKKWRSKACGIVCLAMLFEYFGKKISPNEILKKGLKLNGYLENIGWRHKVLVEIAKHYDFMGKNLDWSEIDAKIAFRKTLIYLNKYPIMVSIHNSFNPSRGGHLVVLTKFNGKKVFYNDPDSYNVKNLAQSITLKKFLDGWKKRIIIIYPPADRKRPRYLGQNHAFG
ncbi:MAG: Uncharacterized protein Athens071426_172 [Parcubacteria group bacterium Athens0714_26]|nr:MAG: Uncharacterized protein Athens101426_278 [Parcubacteria group bacterium Athens1014_26]TSD03628.1 MAG: Uncharacterized protein Athens071426_172 [Parcubacteria group bacterium Athens0714_26]